jgi:putative transposase
MRYRRQTQANCCYFFTVNLLHRRSGLLLSHIETLRQAFIRVKADHPFQQIAVVILPDHLHTIWRLPAGDSNYALRWALIKSGFSRNLPHGEPRSPSRQQKRERGIWQRRYWEHCIRDQYDLEQHIAYIHFNPVKHGYVKQASDWPHSSIHHFIERGILPLNWGD